MRPNARDLVWFLPGLVALAALLAAPRLADAQRTGGSFGGSAWGSGARPQRPSRPSSPSWGSGYDYNRNRHPTRYNSQGGGSCAASLAVITVGLASAIATGRRRR